MLCYQGSWRFLDVPWHCNRRAWEAVQRENTSSEADCTPGARCGAQDVVILGSGAFACEAMEEAVANGARSVTLVARKRRRCCSPPSASARSQLHS